MDDRASWVFVAGGSGGIGAATCRALAEDGWNVAIAYRSNAEAARAVLAELGDRAVVVQVDLTDESRTAEALAEVPGLLGGVVYAAGPAIPMRYVSQISPSLFREKLLDDAAACFNLLQPSIPVLRETGGSIVAVVTPAMFRYAKKDLISSAPKAAIQQVVKGIAAEEGRNGIRANCVGVGLLQGEGMWQDLVAAGDYTEELLDVALRNLALRRFGSVEDVAEAVRFLISSRAGWITGQTLNVDGGYAL